MPEHQRIEGRVLRRALITSVTASTLGCIWVAVALGVSMTMLMLHLGASGFQIGLVVTVQQLAVIAQLPSAFWVQRLPRRRPFWAATALIHRLLWFAPVVVLLVPGLSNPARVTWILIAVSLSALVAHGGAIAWHSWMADLIPQRISGRFWGVRQTVTMASLLVGAWLAGVTLDRFAAGDVQMATHGFVLVFAVAGVMGVADILLHWTVPEPPPTHADRKETAAELLRRVWSDHDFRFVTLAMGVWMFTVGLVGPFAPVFLRERFEASYTHLGFLAVAGSLGGLLSGIPLGRLIDRVGARTVGAILILAAPTLGMIPWFLLAPGEISVSWGPIAFTLPQFMFWMLPANLMGGALYAGVGLCQIQLVNMVAPKKGRTVALSLHWSIAGLLSALGPITGGLMVDILKQRSLGMTLFNGQPMAYFHVQLLVQTTLAVLIAVPLMRRVHERGTGLPRNFAMALLRLGNPVRLITSLYNVYVVRTIRNGNDPSGEEAD